MFKVLGKKIVIALPTTIKKMFIYAKEEFVMVVVPRLFLINMVLTTTIQSLSVLSSCTSLPLYDLPTTSNIPLIACVLPKAILASLFLIFVISFFMMIISVKIMIGRGISDILLIVSYIKNNPPST